MEKEVVALLDGNNFFVSCERLFRPDLAKRPVLVLSSNDGCVVARSSEVKDMGIPMGVPYFQIKDIIKDKGITCFSSNFALYRDLSRRLFSLVKQEVTIFEQYSIDEGFFLLPAAGAADVATRIRERIVRELGLPVSVGIAGSKTLAKLAARRAKKGNGVEEITMSSWEKLAPDVSLGELWGVGARRALAFRTVGLLSAQDMREASFEWVRSQFGLEGARLWAELHGEKAYPVAVASSQQESVMHSRSFGSRVLEKETLVQAVLHHTQRGIDDLRRLDLAATRMVVFVGSGRAAGGGSARFEVVLGVPTDDPMLLVGQAKHAIDHLYEKGFVYKRAGVVFGGLVPKAGLPISLFEVAGQGADRGDIGDVLHEIKLRWGKGAVQIGVVHTNHAWQSRQQSLSPAYTTNWSQIPQIVCQ